MVQSLNNEITPHDQGDLGGVVARIAGTISDDRFPTGDRASLRRMHPDQPPPMKFCGFAVRHLPEGWEGRLKDWMTLVAGIALMAPNAHRSKTGLGKALANAKFSELRLERLLAARGDLKRILLLGTSRFLAAKGEPFNWKEGAQLLMTEDPQKREWINFRIARDFYSAIREE